MINTEGVFKYQFRKVTKKFKAGVTVIDSPAFHVRGLPWKIQLKAYKNAETQGFERLGCYLFCTYEKPGYSCNAEYSLKALPPPSDFEIEKFTHKFTGTGGRGYNEILKWSTLINPNECYIASDSLTIQVHLKAEMPQGMTEQSPKDKVEDNLRPAAKCALEDCYGALLESEDGANVTFIVKIDPTLPKTTGVKAHKEILKARSPVFAAMFSADMIENNLNQVEIKDIREASFRILLNHIYTGNLRFPDKIEADLEVCKEVVMAADMYNFPELKEYAGMAVAEFVNPENAWELLKYVKLHKANAAAKSIGTFIKQNVKSMIAVA